MANRIKRKQPIDKDWFRWVCDQRGMSMNGLAKKTRWSSRQIRDGVNDGEMTPELLDACAKALDVHPDYLAGKYCRTLDYDIMRDEETRQHWLETAMAPAAHPYKYFKQQGINTRVHFYDTLLLHGVERDAFESLSRNEQEDIERALDWAETSILRKRLRSRRRRPSRSARGKGGSPSLPTRRRIWRTGAARTPMRRSRRARSRTIS